MRCLPIGVAYTQTAHEMLHGTARDRKVFAVHLLPNLIGAIDLQVGLPDTFNLRHHYIIALGPGAAQFRISLPSRMTSVS